MKNVNVPAQITTVEDIIMGNLTLRQIMLLATPVFLDFVLYVVLPRSMSLNIYKTFLMLALTLICILAAVRARGKLLLDWFITITKYKLRPSHYVFDKNTICLRHYCNTSSPRQQQADKSKKKTLNISPKARENISVEDNIRLNELLASPSLQLSFIAHKKSGLRVHVTETK